MFIIPGVFVCIFFLVSINKTNNIFNILLASILFSGILSVSTFSLIFDYLEKMKIIDYYY